MKTDDLIDAAQEMKYASEATLESLLNDLLVLYPFRSYACALERAGSKRQIVYVTDAVPGTDLVRFAFALPFFRDSRSIASMVEFLISEKDRGPVMPSDCDFTSAYAEHELAKKSAEERMQCLSLFLLAADRLGFEAPNALKESTAFWALSGDATVKAVGPTKVEGAGISSGWCTEPADVTDDESIRTMAARIGLQMRVVVRA